MQLILLSFKINFFKCEVILIIAVINDKACIKNSFINLFSKFFTFLLIFLFDSKYFYMWTHVIKILHKMLVTLNIEDCYLNYFFHQDVAILIHWIKLLKNEIQLLERWKFNSYHLYIKAHSNYILNISRRYQR